MNTYIACRDNQGYLSPALLARLTATLGDRPVRAYTLLRRRKNGTLTDAEVCGNVYGVGEITRHRNWRGLPVFASPFDAIDYPAPEDDFHYPVPDPNPGAELPAPLAEVYVPSGTRLERRQKVRVPCLYVARILADYPAWTVQLGSAERRGDAETWLAEGWGQFRVVPNLYPFGCHFPEHVKPECRGRFGIVCREPTGRGSTPTYRYEPSSSCMFVG